MYAEFPKYLIGQIHCACLPIARTMCFEEEDFMFFAAADDGAVEGKTLIGMASCWSFAKDQCR